MGFFKGRPASVFLIYGLAGFLLYASALDSVFTYDDTHQIIQNTSIRGLAGIPSFFKDIASGSRSPVETQQYRPLLLSTFAINYALGGLNPVGYHLVNLLFHIVSAFLVFLIVKFMLREWRGGFVAGLIMLFHPFNSEGVNYVTARSSVMATLFYLLAFYAYLRYRPCYQESASGAGIKEERGWLYLSWGAFVLGMLTKEIVITLPLVLILYEWLKGGLRGIWERLGPGIAPFIAVPVVYLIIKKLIVGVMGPTTVVRGVAENLLIQVKALASTWQMLVFPVNLTIEHAVPAVHSILERAFLAAMALFVILILSMIGLFRSGNRLLRVTGFFLAWFYVTLLPTTLIPLNAVLQENRGYIAAVAFAGMMGVLVIAVDSILEGRGRPVLVSVFGLILILYAIEVWERNRVWGDEVSLWQDAVLKSPDSYGPRFGLGSAYQRLGRLDQAEVEYLNALRIEDRDPVLHNDLGALYNETGRPDLALQQFNAAIRMDPDYDLAHSNLGLLYMQKGQKEEAARSFETAIRLNPFNETALVNLGILYQQQGRREKAIEIYARAIERNPNLYRAQMEMGLAYQQQGDHAAAIQAFEKVLSLSPSFMDAYMALGKEYLSMNRPKEAIRTLQQALTIQPNDGFGYLTLGKLYEQTGDRGKARDLYKKVLTLDSSEERNKLAISLARKELEGFR